MPLGQGPALSLHAGFLLKVSGIAFHCPNLPIPSGEELVKSVLFWIKYFPFVQAFPKSSWFQRLCGSVKRQWQFVLAFLCNAQKPFPLPKYPYLQKCITSQYLCRLPEHCNILGGEGGFPREMTHPDFLIKQQRVVMQTDIQMPFSHPIPQCVNPQLHLVCPQAMERWAGCVLPALPSAMEDKTPSTGW